MEKQELYAGMERKKNLLDKIEEIDEEGVKKGKRRRTRREGGERGRKRKKRLCGEKIHKEYYNVIKKMGKKCFLDTTKYYISLFPMMCL